MTCGIGPVPPVSVSSEETQLFRAKNNGGCDRTSRPSHLNVVLSKAVLSGPSVCLRARTPCPLCVSCLGADRAESCVLLRSDQLQSDQLQRTAPSYRLWRSSASFSRITWACRKGCRPAFLWLLGSRQASSRRTVERMGDQVATGSHCLFRSNRSQEGTRVVLNEPNKTVNKFYLHGTNSVLEGLRHCLDFQTP